jgi:hypothetical protein
MPQLLVQITEEQAAWLDARCDRFSPKSRLVRDLIDYARLGVDASATLAERATATLPKGGVAIASEASTSNSSLEQEKNKTRVREGKKSKDLPTVYPPDFEAFWKAYQQLPEKASKQAKPLALNAWKVATKVNTPEELLQAVANTLAIQQREMASERGFTVCLPDCFRWLRDGCHLAALEAHSPAQRSSVW